MDYEEAWNELKSRMKSQHGKAVELDNRAGSIIGHVYKDVTDNMWSLEKKMKKEVK